MAQSYTSLLSIDAEWERANGKLTQPNGTLLAAHVRTNHIHLVIEGEARPERIMNDLKDSASRCLNQTGWDAPDRKRWDRHGSTRWLWKPEHVSAGIHYVVEEQGGPWHGAVRIRVC